MEFSGRKDNVFKEKLPEGFAQADQNSRRRTRGIWRPRQGLSRPAGIGKAAQRIDSIGYGEVGIKTGLMIEHGGSIDGYAIGVNDVSPVWTPPPPRDWFYEVPTLTVLQTGDGEVTLTPSSGNDYTTTFFFYRDGVFIGDGNTLVDTDAVDGADYTTEAVTDGGAASVPSLPVTAAVYPGYISDDFNRADGLLVSPWVQGPATRELTIVSERVTVNATGAGSQGRVVHSTSVPVPITVSMDLARTGTLSAGSGSFVSWAINLFDDDGLYAQALLKYKTIDDLWQVEAWRGGSGADVSATTSGQPPASTTLIVTVDAGGTISVSAGGKTASIVNPTAPVGNMRIQLYLIADGNDGDMWLDNFVAFGGL